MKEWFTLSELADLKLPDMPTSLSKVHDLSVRLNWRAGPFCRKVERKGGGFEYHVSLLPQRAQIKLAAIASTDAAREETREKRKRLYWSRWEAMSDKHRQICHDRLAVLHAVTQAEHAAALADTGETKTEIIDRVLDRHGAARSSYYAWKKAVADVDEEDWLPALAPHHAEDGTADRKFAACHEMAWNALKADYLRPERPSFSACYRRVIAAAKTHGWTPIPTERALRRRFDAEVPTSAQVYAREGKKRAEQLYPPQIRVKTHLHAMEILNTDGHQIDLFVWAPWNSKSPVRVILLGIQDVYSGKILSWRLASAETWDVVRACIGDTIEDYGIPQHFYMDNGRAFASKVISGGAEHRNRFRKPKENRFGIEEEEVAGILKTFGIEPHFTRPYAGQSKPIERAWKDLAEEISKHPSMSGCYTGNKPDAKPENYRSKAVQLSVLQEHVAQCIAEHNARPGRRSDTANGKSFDEVFAESMRHPATIVRRASDAQREYWMLAEHVLKVRKNRGEIHYQKNVYWAAALNDWCGKTVKIRFDPDRLHDPIKVYAPNGSLICEAPCTDKGKFRDIEAANIHNRNRRAFLKTQKAMVEMHQKLTAEELGNLYAAGDAAKPKRQPIRPAITRIATGNLAVAPDQDVMTDAEFEAGIAASLSEISSDSSIIPFPPLNQRK